MLALDVITFELQKMQGQVFILSESDANLQNGTKAILEMLAFELVT
jgi:hypothetical protein